MEFDLLVRGGTVVDGGGGPRRRADVGVIGDRIAAVDDLSAATGRTVIDARGRIVSPGFIDVHTHSETALLGWGHRFGGLLQGVTTYLTAPDGFGWAGLPLDLAAELWDTTLFCYGRSEWRPHWPAPEAYLALFPGCSPGNIVPQAPHCAIRLGVMGWADRIATDDELARMKTALRGWMDAGAVSLSLGLDYQPSAFSDTRELIELTRVAGEYGGIYNAHIRGQILGREGAWRETIEVGERSGVPVHIAHEYVNEVTAPLLAEAADRCDLTFESYMYPAGSTHLQFNLPAWAQQGGQQGLRARLADPAQRARIRDAMETKLTQLYATGARQIISTTQSGRYVGMSVPEAARASGESLGAFALRMFDEEPFVLTVNHRAGGPEVHDRMIAETARHPRMLVASDGIYHGPHPHPRAFGCHVRVLRLCVRERGLLTLEEAVHKMTGMPADRFGIAERGFVRGGQHADLVIFDEATVADRATWEAPLLEPVGIDAVVVNGQIVVEAGTPTGRLPGQVARRRASRRH